MRKEKKNKGPKITDEDIVYDIARVCRVRISEAEKIMRAILDIWKEELVAHRPVRLKGMGRLRPYKLPGFKRTDPRDPSRGGVFGPKKSHSIAFKLSPKLRHILRGDSYRDMPWYKKQKEEERLERQKRMKRKP